MSRQRVGILHPGAMGVSIALSVKDAGCDVVWASEGRRRQSAERAAEAGLQDVGTVERMCQTCQIILSVVPPEFASEVARRVASSGFRGVFADVNALAPHRKVEMGTELAAQGIRFADGGIIGLPSRAPGETMVFLSGPAAEEVAACFTGAAIAASTMGPEIGRASALKILFAAYNKGSIALFAALYAAGERYGVLEELKGQFTHRGLSVPKIEAQMLRAAPKAWRWVPEMHEIAASLEAADMPGDFHQAAAEIYGRLADLKDTEPQLSDVLSKLAAGR